MKLPIKLLHNNSYCPQYATEGAAGFDLHSMETVVINPGQWESIRTGIAVAVPEGFEMQIRSRSGLAKRRGLIVHQSVGTIDSDYRGEIIVMIRNVSMATQRIEYGDRIAQAIIAPVQKIEFDIVNELCETERGSNGFGSTGS